MMLKPLDREDLRKQFAAAKPFPYIEIENFLDPDFALEVANAYPSFDQAAAQGRVFTAVNEHRKVQVTDSARFPAPVRRLHEALASPEFLDDLSYITGIPRLLADEKLEGGGMHLTGPGGRLDVHVDFNYMPERQLHRRINLLLYLNPHWEEQWGGQVQFWDRDVKQCQQAFSPKLNRCVIFETSDISYHGVVPVGANAPAGRCSFAAYYYTREAPQDWKGTVHTTVFRARPEEKLRGYLLMPVEKAKRNFAKGTRQHKKKIRRLVAGA